MTDITAPKDDHEQQGLSPSDKGAGDKLGGLMDYLTTSTPGTGGFAYTQANLQDLENRIQEGFNLVSLILDGRADEIPTKKLTDQLDFNNKYFAYLQQRLPAISNESSSATTMADTTQSRTKT